MRYSKILLIMSTRSKFIRLVLTIIIASICVSSCEKDDAILHSEYPLEGTFMFEGVDQFSIRMWTEAGQEVPYTDSELNLEYEYSKEIYSKTAQYTFYKNGNFIFKDTDDYLAAKYFIKDSIVYIQVDKNLFYSDTVIAFLRYREGKLMGYRGSLALYKEGASIYHFQKFYLNPINMLDTSLRKLRYPSLNVLLKDDYLIVEQHRALWNKK